jgi:hypothetical protein
LYRRAQEFLQKVVLDVCFINKNNMHMADMGPYKMDLLCVSHGGFITEFINVIDNYNDTRVAYNRVDRKIINTCVNQFRLT